jgi:CxxC-x17-CxxC domain-containing protein
MDMGIQVEAETERTCVICDESFLIPAAERQFRRDRGLQDPVECPTCRARLRSARNADLIAIYARGDSPGLGEQPSIASRTGASNGSRSTSRSNVSHQRYNTVCAACGSETQVPFIPRGDKPVYCRECFNARKGR